MPAASRRVTVRSRSPPSLELTTRRSGRIQLGFSPSSHPPPRPTPPTLQAPTRAVCDAYFTAERAQWSVYRCWACNFFCALSPHTSLRSPRPRGKRGQSRMRCRRTPHQEILHPEPFRTRLVPGPSSPRACSLLPVCPSIGAQTAVSGCAWPYTSRRGRRMQILREAATGRRGTSRPRDARATYSARGGLAACAAGGGHLPLYLTGESPASSEHAWRGAQRKRLAW